MGRFDESLAWLHKAIEIDPDFAIGYLMIGLHYWGAEGQLDEAVRWFRKSVSVDPGSPRVIRSLFSAGFSWISAISIAPSTGSSDPSSWARRDFLDPNFAMQLLHLYLGDEATALDYARKSHANFPRSPNSPGSF